MHFQNCVIDNSLPPITKKNWSLTFLLLITKQKLYEIPPGPLSHSRQMAGQNYEHNMVVT